MKCDHCHKELGLVSVYCGGALLHQECRVPYLNAQRDTYEERVSAYELQGLTTSDAQAVVDAEEDKATAARHESQRTFKYAVTGREDFGGAFDGFRVTSDADEGL